MYPSYSENPVVQQNQRLLGLILPGDVLKIPTECHTHYGLYVGYGNMIHIAAIKSGQHGHYDIEVKEESYMSVAKDNIVSVDNEDDCYHTDSQFSRDQIVTRAKRKLGAMKYEAIFQSCKVFVDWCRYGKQARHHENYDQLIMCHNFNVARTLERGDIVEIKRKLYSHFGIYVGNTNIIHVSGDDRSRLSVSGMPLFNSPHTSEVKLEPLLSAAQGFLLNKANKDDNRSPLPQDEIVKRAYSKLGPIPYQALYKNCEHFVNDCRYGVEVSSQSRAFVGAVVLGSALGGFVLGGPFGAFAASSISAYKLIRHSEKNTPEKNKK
ncbi:Phospholipase A and acyltransferase 2 [Bulinus truncatus]|nr:Phospholipase A and acyltransferase 2 [Bulinus truncatus]